MVSFQKSSLFDLNALCLQEVLAAQSTLPSSEKPPSSKDIALRETMLHLREEEGG